MKNLPFKNKINYLSAASIAFSDYRVYVPIALLWAAFNFKTLLLLIKFPTYNRGNLKLTLISIIYIISIFGIGYSNMTLDQPFKYMIAIIFQIAFVFLIFSTTKIDCYKNILDGVVFGYLLNSTIIIGYSTLYSSSYIGYGSLTDPFTGLQLNTPHISNSIAVVFSYYFSKLFIMESKFNTTLYALTCGMMVIFAIILAGRTFFIISICIITLCLLHRSDVKSIASLLIFIIVGLTLFTYFASSENSIYIDFLLNRFENGIESSRSNLYLYALTQMFNYPLGGFSVNSSVADTLWFHNIFFDTARVAGWFPLFFLIFFYSSFASKVINLSSDSVLLQFKAAFISLFLVAQQDVIIEGNSKIFLATYISIICLSSINNISFFHNTKFKVKGKN